MNLSLGSLVDGDCSLEEARRYPDRRAVQREGREVSISAFRRFRCDKLVRPKAEAVRCRMQHWLLFELPHCAANAMQSYRGI